MFAELLPLRSFEYVQWTSPEKALLVERFLQKYTETYSPPGRLTLNLFFEGDTYQEKGVNIVNGIPKPYNNRVVVPEGVVAVQVSATFPRNECKMLRGKLGEIFDRRILPPKGGPV